MSSQSDKDATRTTSSDQPGAGARDETRVPGGSNAAQDGIARSTSQVSEITVEKSSVSPALARAREAQIDPSDKDARINLIVELMGAGTWVSKVTPKELAELFAESGVAISWETIEHNASDAGRIVRLMSDPSFVRAKYWQRVEVHDRDVDELVRATMEDAKTNPPLNSLDVKALAEAKAKPLELRERSIERLAKVGGLLQSGGTTAVSVRVDVGDGKTAEAPVTQLALENSNCFAWIRAEHPELAEEYLEKVVKTAARGEKYSLTVKEGA